MPPSSGVSCPRPESDRQPAQKLLIMLIQYDVHWDSMTCEQVGADTMRQVVFLPDGGGGYVVEVPSLPGCRAKGKNISEAITNTRHAIYAHIENLKASGQPVPESTVVDIPKAEGVIND